MRNIVVVDLSLQRKSSTIYFPGLPTVGKATVEPHQWYEARMNCKTDTQSLMYVNYRKRNYYKAFLK